MDENARKLRALERRFERGRQRTFSRDVELSTPAEVQAAFKTIRDNRLYCGRYATFEEYCEFEWGYYGDDLKALLEENHAQPHQRAVRTEEKPKSRDGGIYFAQCGDFELVKIGWAVNFKSRLATLQTGCPFPLKLIGSMEGDAQKERRLHKRFADLRVSGEWFTLDFTLRTFISVCGGAS